MGMGIHGEPGIWRDKLKPADAIADEMVERLLADRPANAGDRVSRAGQQPRRHAARRAVHPLPAGRGPAQGAGTDIVGSLVGPFVTSMEMAGVSISFCFVDDELDALLAAPADCPFWRVG